MPNKVSVESQIAFLQGYKQAVEDYGIWENGKRHIGCQQTPVAEIVQDINAKITGLQVQLDLNNSELKEYSANGVF